MKTEFAIGDVVVLRSGGPYMTVNDIDEDNGLLECIWFNEEDEKELDHFRPEVLDEAEEEELDIDIEETDDDGDLLEAEEDPEDEEEDEDEQEEKIADATVKGKRN